MRECILMAEPSGTHHFLLDVFLFSSILPIGTFCGMRPQVSAVRVFAGNVKGLL